MTAISTAAGLQELSPGEVEAVNGAIAPVLGGLVVRYAVNRLIGYSAKVSAQRAGATTAAGGVTSSSSQN